MLLSLSDQQHALVTKYSGARMQMIAMELRNLLGPQRN